MQEAEATVLMLVVVLEALVLVALVVVVALVVAVVNFVVGFGAALTPREAVLNASRKIWR